MPLLVDYEVWAIGKSSGLQDDVCWVSYDLSMGLDGLSAALPKQMDAVIHLAQSPHFREFPAHSNHVFSVNVASTMFLLNEAAERGCHHFIYASTGSVYSGKAPFVESKVNINGNVISMYPASKLCGDLLE